MVKQLKEVGEGAEILAKRFEKEKAQLEKENSERAEDVARLEKEKADLQARIDGIGEERDEEKRQLEELLREVGKAATAARKEADDCAETIANLQKTAVSLRKSEELADSYSSNLEHAVRVSDELISSVGVSSAPMRLAVAGIDFDKLGALAIAETAKIDFAKLNAALGRIDLDAAMRAARVLGPPRVDEENEDDE